MYTRLLLAGALIYGGTSASGVSFPPVKPIHRLINVPDVPNADVQITIPKRSGGGAYRFECHSADYVDATFDYSGEFECRLTQIVSQTKFSTLLTEDSHQSRDWESRGRFFAVSLRGKCAQIKNFGSRRSFRLRGMELTIEIEHPTFQAGKLQSLRLLVNVQPDATASREIAQSVPFPNHAPKACRLKELFE